MPRPGKTPARIPAIEEEFIRLTVISEPWMDRGRRWVLCRCVCGREIPVRINSLLSNNTKSCGCLQKDKVRQRNFRHGAAPRTGIRGELSVWRNMVARCYDPKNTRYGDWGGRGIRVCRRWRGRGGFLNFLEDMGPRPGPQFSLDRRDNDRNYSKRNCRRATAVQQANNSRNNRWLEFAGQKLTLTEWSKRLGLAPGSLHARLSKMSVEEALTKPPEYRGRRKRNA